MQLSSFASPSGVNRAIIRIHREQNSFEHVFVCNKHIQYGQIPICKVNFDETFTFPSDFKSNIFYFWINLHLERIKTSSALGKLLQIIAQHSLLSLIGATFLHFIHVTDMSVFQFQHIYDNNFFKTSRAGF